MEDKPRFRAAVRADVPLILTFIRELADYEGMLDEVVADEATLEEWLFDRRAAEVVFALEEGREVGFALFFHNFSTFLGRSGVYLEDLYVRPRARVRAAGMVVPGLEPPEHRLLPLDGRRAHERLDGLPRRGRGTRGACALRPAAEAPPVTPRADGVEPAPAAIPR